MLRSPNKLHKYISSGCRRALDANNLSVGLQATGSMDAAGVLEKHCPLATPVLFPSHHQPVIWPLALHLLTSKTDKLVKTPRSITAVNFRTYPSLSVERSASTSPAHWTADLKGLHTCSLGWVSRSSATLKPWTAHGGRQRSRGCPLESGLRRLLVLLQQRQQRSPYAGTGSVC